MHRESLSLSWLAPIVIVFSLNYLYDLRYINIPQLAKSFCLQFALSMI